MTSALLTLPEVARRLHVDLAEALRLVESKGIPAGRGRDGGVYVREVDLETFRRASAVNP